MDSSDTNQDPLAANGATSFAPDFDMSAVNEAVAAGGEADNIQNTFNAADIDLSNTPTTDVDLQQQLNANPDMNLANSDTTVAAPVEPTVAQIDPIAAEQPVAEPVAMTEAPVEPVAAPVDMAAPAVDPAQAAPVAAADNPADPTVTQAPEATPPVQPTSAAGPEIKKSKTPTYVLIGLSILAVVSVVIAVIVSLGNK